MPDLLARLLFNAVMAALLVPICSQSASIAQVKSGAHFQTFTCGKTSCSLNIPDSFVMTKKDTQVGPVFAFSDPTKNKAEGSFFSISIVPEPGKANVTEFTDGVLDPYRQGLDNFREEKLAPVTIGGSVFENRQFSGTFPKGTPTTGFVYVALKDSCYFSLIGGANGVHAADPKIQLREIVKSFH